MRSYRIHLSRDTATFELSASLRKISNTALRHVDHASCYGNIETTPNATIFNIGLGPNNWCTAKGTIEAIDSDTCTLSYRFNVPFIFSLYSHLMINAHFKRVFEKHLIK